jgi:VanZ family protein
MYKYFYFLLIASLSGIYFATIFPGNFIIPNLLSWQYISEQFYHATNIKDYIRNILLFLPLGISLSGTIAPKKYQEWQIIIINLLLSAILSSNIELIQILLPGRTSSVSDIVCNSIGGILGASLYCWRRDLLTLLQAIVTQNYQEINLKILTVVMISYYSTIALGMGILINNINLSNWNNYYRLAIGSEVTGNVPWNGYLTSLYICDRSLNQQEVIQAFTHTHTFFSQLPSLITSYIFLTKQKFYQGQSLQLPDLFWLTKDDWFKTNMKPKANNLQKSTIDYQIHHQKNVLFNRKNNLISSTAMINLNQKIKQSQEFTLSLIAATNKYQQVGPARIISLAQNISNRNLMVGQEDKNLTFRLRTPTTGETASQPEFIIPNVFTDQNLHQILITFAQRKLTFYIDQPEHQYTYEFQPSTSFGLYLPWTIKQWRINLQNFNFLRSQIKFYGMVSLPIIIIFISMCINYRQK